MKQDAPLIKVENLSVRFDLGGGLFSRKKGEVKAVDDVSFEIGKGEILGLVGESGSGKTTTGRAIIRLAPVASGKIFFDKTELTGLSNRRFMPYRKKIQMIFQDPFNSLDPKMTVGETIAEPLDIHFSLSKKEREIRIKSLLERVGLNPDFASRYPHEFSGGQRQRIGIARALAVEPEFIICDEPVSALDVSVQAQIVNLLEDLRRELNIAMLFIAHDLAVVEHISDRIIVMTNGKIVEEGEAEELCKNPKHPYTKKLIAAIPSFL
ncbi:ABC transporter ATP-binding protein [Intestinicryptomonas porci]|uniref:ABC transporter ATP-binding protein n=1 Tax=Intestinicryptomonas porci TaxID=2926320 RepID=UPI003515B7DB